MLRRLKNLWLWSNIEPKEKVKGFKWTGWVKATNQAKIIEMRDPLKDLFKPQ